MKSPIVIYLGPSMLDGSPIVVLASTGSSNVKTGPMVQTWIMRADMHPSEASATKADDSVCGLCPRRHALGGDCYVQIVHAPRSVWESWDRQGKPGTNWTEQGAILPLTQDARDHGLRVGSYGDPMAVPFTVWADLIDALAPSKIVGYTHQWRRVAASVTVEIHGTIVQSIENRDWYRANLMASVDSVSEAVLARSLGWRFFLATDSDDPQIDRVIQCPATRDQNPLTCTRCGACSGAGDSPDRASIYLTEHGMRSQSKAKRSAMLAVLS